MIKIYFILLILIILPAVLTASFDLFSSSATFNSRLNNGTASIIKIASDQSMIVAGFVNGSVIAYNFFGSYITQFVGHTNQIIDIEWVSGVGPMTLDNSGKVIRWTTNGTNIVSMSLNSSVSEMAITESNTTKYVGFNYGFKVSEYSMTNSSFVAANTYTAQGGSFFRKIMYSFGYQFLFVGTNTSQVQFFSCSSGSITNSSFSLNNQSTVQAFAPFSNQNYLLLTTNSQVFRFSTSVNSVLLDTTNPLSSTLVTCPQSFWIAMGESSYDYLDIYDSSMFRQQHLGYLFNTVKSLDCSQNYLVSLDNSNYLAVNKYQSITINLPPWAIGVIAGGVALIVIVIIIVIIVVVRRRRSGLNAGLNNSVGGQQLLMNSPNNQYGNNQYGNQPVFVQNNYEQRF